jgi:group II intron reverse transcriptase/maturase
MAGKQILTHPKVRKLQRTLYQQAKKNPKWKAWSLYADLCRTDFIEEAMSRILSNRGGSGVDGYTVEAMEADWNNFRDCLQKELRDKSYAPSPVKRISIPKPNGGERKLGIPTVKDRVVQMILVLLIEPIFEADFHDESYGYRRGKKATEAIKSISTALYYGKTMVLEADLSRYFDTIEHERLLKLIKKRVSDGAILSLIKHFLRVPVVEEDEKGKRRTISRGKKGVPQGGVISPLLANLYLDKLDCAVNALDPARVKMVRYADDFVILMKGGLEEVMLERVKTWLRNAGLKLNESKTKLTDVSKRGKVEFLGFELSERSSPKTGNRYIHCRPSKKSRQRFREKIREELHHWSTWKNSSVAIVRVNRITRGWGNYFHHGHSPKDFRSLNYWLKNRTRNWLAEKHRVRDKSKYKAFPDVMIQKEMGLYVLPSQAAWVNRK